MPRKKKIETNEESNITSSAVSNSNGSIKKKSLAERLSIMDSLCSEANKNGLALAGRISECKEVEERLTVRYIPTPCEDVNLAVGGGLPRGKMTVVSGAPDSGKTTFLLETIGKNMNLPGNEDFIAVWIESENSIDKNTVVKMFNIDPDRFFFIAQNKESGAEGIGDMITNILCSDMNPDMIVINSLKMLVSKGEIDKSLTKQSMAEQARFNSRLMNKLIPMLAEADCALAVVQPLSTNLAVMYGNNMILSGGLAIRYAAAMQWEFNKLSIQESDPIKKEEGLKIKMTVRKNHCLTDRFPYVSVEYYVEFGKGIEQVLSMLKLLINNGILTQKGAWIYYLDKDGNKQEDWTWNSKASFKADMNANPEKLETLKALLGGVNTIQQLSDEEIEEIEKTNKADEAAMAEIGD